ncbi:MAG: hypothetical protein HOK52_14930 [Candidatus Marinimicrobia bacterium]|jgi:hypothetical protein|nr:hypothetical protein [Candidatus Neomarinimicrobiota bacterium]
MTKSWHGGKGSSPRKQSDRKQFEDNWDKIFGKTEEPKPEESKIEDDVS